MFTWQAQIKYLFYSDCFYFKTICFHFTLLELLAFHLITNLLQFPPNPEFHNWTLTIIYYKKIIYYWWSSIKCLNLQCTTFWGVSAELWICSAVLLTNAGIRSIMNNEWVSDLWYISVWQDSESSCRSGRPVRRETSPLSEDESPVTVKFLKMSCKYFTDGMVSLTWCCFTNFPRSDFWFSLFFSEERRT